MKKPILFFGIVFFFAIRSVLYAEVNQTFTSDQMTGTAAAGISLTATSAALTSTFLSITPNGPTLTARAGLTLTMAVNLTATEAKRQSNLTTSPQAPQPTATSAPGSSSGSSDPAPTALPTVEGVPTISSDEATLSGSPTPTPSPSPTPAVLGEQTKELDRFDVTVVVVDKKSHPINRVKVTLGEGGEAKRTNGDGKLIFTGLKRGKHTFFAYYNGEMKIKIVKAQGTTKGIETTIEFERGHPLLKTIIKLLLTIALLAFLQKRGYFKRIEESPRLAPIFAKLNKLLNKLPLTKIKTLFDNLLSKFSRK